MDKLEKKKLLIRTPYPEDRRIIYASITDAGKEMMDEIFPLHSKQIQKILGGLDKEEKKVVIEQLKKLGLFARSV